MPRYIGSDIQPLRLRTSVYVDLSNFIGELRNLLKLGEFRDSEDRYIKLSEALASTVHYLFITLSNRNLYGYVRLTPFKLYCYGSYTGSERGSFNAFKDYLKSLGDVEIHLVERSKGEREKGIDIMLATDMLVHAVWNNYDVAILISGDADFEPLIRRVRDLGKKVYISFYPYAIAEKLREASDGAMLFHPETLMLKSLATTIVTKFKEEFLSSIKTLIEEFETKNYFKPLREIESIKENIKVIKEELQNLNLTNIMKSLEELHKHISTTYQQFYFPLSSLLFALLVLLNFQR